MSLYLDTSVLVATFMKEAHSKRVERWLDQQDQADLVVSDWVITEFSERWRISCGEATLTNTEEQPRSRASRGFALTA